MVHNNQPDTSMRVVSYNCRGLSDNRVNVIRELLSCNKIVFLQEHWQFEDQLHKLNISDTHASRAISGMNAGLQIQLGRPFGGVAILWDKRLNNYIQTVDTGSKRIAPILYTRNVYTLLFITAYIPCDTGTCDITKVDEFSEVLNDISLLIQKVNPSDVASYVIAIIL